MRGMTHGIYSTVLRVQAMVGLVLASWLVSMVLGRGQYASAPLIIGVFAGLIGLACLWPFLTPGWLGRPRRRTHLVAMLSAHLVLPLLYGFVGMSAIVAANLADPFGGQLAVVIAAVLIATAILCGSLGARLCLVDTAGKAAARNSVVTELVLPQATRPHEVASQPARQNPLSRAS